MTPGRSETMTKKGQKGTYHKPKPRVAVYAGLVGTGALAAGAIPNVVPHTLTLSAKGSRLTEAGQNLGAIVTDLSTAAEVAAPAVIGVVVSVGADKLGVNKVLAKMKLPSRV